MAQVLLGYTSSTDDGVRKFERDLTLDMSAGDVMTNCFFVNFSRLLTKDQIKKARFRLNLVQAVMLTHSPRHVFMKMCQLQ